MFVLSELTRKEKMLIWMKRNDESYSDVAKKLGISRQAATYLLNAEEISPIRHSQLVEMGIPESLLPLPVYKKPGPSS